MKIRRCVYAALWILSLVGISFYGGAISYGFFFMLTLVPVISFIYLVAVYFGFRIYQEVDSRDMVCNEPMSYYYVLENGSPFGFAGVGVRMFSGFSYVEDIPDDTENELLPGDKQTFHTKLICKYKGEYEVGIKEVIVTDFFRLFSVKYRMPGAIKAIVHPRTIALNELTALQDVRVFLQKEALRGQSELDTVVRDYLQGDSLRRIHWQASAKEWKLKTRLQTGEEKQGITILCDRTRYYKAMSDYLPLESQLVEATLAISYFFAQKGISYGVYTGWSMQPHFIVQGMQSYEGLYTYMSNMAFMEDSSVEAQLTDTEKSGLLRDSKLLILVCHRVSEDILHRVRELAEYGIMVVIYLVTDGDAEEILRQASERVQIVKVPITAKLEGVL